MFENHRYQISAGDVFIINPGESHTYEVNVGEKLEIVNCLFIPALIEKSWLREVGISQSMDYFYVHPFLDDQERFHHRLNLHNNGNQLLLILEAMINEFHEKRTGYCKIIRLQLVELLILLSRFYQEQNSKRLAAACISDHQLLVKRICGYLERHYNQKLSVETICEMFNISTRQLNRIFKQETNRTVIEMVQHIRVERAKHFLLTTNDKVITIAGKVGYDDPAFFLPAYFCALLIRLQENIARRQKQTISNTIKVK